MRTSLPPVEGVFYDGQIFDAYKFAADLIRSAKKSIQLQLDLQKHNSQYPPIGIHTCKKCHDRFLIIDGAEVWHIGASLKDLGRKMFAFSRLGIPAEAVTGLL